jgi:hypothetical protein
MTCRPFVTCSFTSSLLATLLVGVAPLPAVAAAGDTAEASRDDRKAHSLFAPEANTLPQVCLRSGCNIHLVIDPPGFPKISAE